MSNTNIVVLSGNLTADPRGNDSGTICNLRIANNRRRKVGDEWTDVAGYYDVVVIRQAKPCREHLGKGRHVTITGELQWREWTDKDGNKRQQVEILANEVEFGARPEARQEQSSEEGW